MFHITFEIAAAIWSLLDAAMTLMQAELHDNAHDVCDMNAEDYLSRA